MSLSRSVGLGFVGCGRHAKKAHCDVLPSMDNFFWVAGLCDVNSDAFYDFTPHGFVNTLTFYTESVDELLSSSDVEAVIIATPPQYHMEILEKAIAAGKHVLIEKPIWVGNEKDRFVKLASMARSRGLVLTSCHPRRFDPAYLKVLQLGGEVCLGNHGIGCGCSMGVNFGEMLSFNFRFVYHKLPLGWRQNDSLLLDHLNHEIDLLSFFQNFCRFKIANGLTLVNVYDGPDRYCVNGLLESGASINFLGRRCLEERNYINELELLFERGRISAFSSLNAGKVLVRVAVDNFDTQARNRNPIMISCYPYIDCFRSLMFQFHGEIIGMRSPYLSLDEMVLNNDSCNSLISGSKRFVFPEPPTTLIVPETGC